MGKACRTLTNMSAVSYRQSKHLLLPQSPRKILPHRICITEEYFSYKSHSKFCTPKMIRSLWTKYLSFHISSLSDFTTEVFPVTLLVIPWNIHHLPSPHSFHSKKNYLNEYPKAIKLTKSLILIIARRSVCVCMCVSIVKYSMLKALQYLTICNFGLLAWAPVI